MSAAVSHPSQSPAMEIVESCLVCGSTEFTTAFEEPPYAIRRCERCGFGWTTPRFTQERLAAIYQADAYWRSPSPKVQGYSDYRADERLYLDTFRKRLDFVLRAGPRSGRALDVGCAAGFCMAAMRERGFETHGLEVSEVIARHAREHFGFDTVYVGTLETSPYPDGFFDLITMWDVVEHVVDPYSLLRRAQSLLAPGGLLVIETQDIDSRFARLLGPRWHHYKHEEHIYHFTASTIRTLLGACGLEVADITHRYGGKYVSFDFIAERASRLHPALSRLLRPLTRLRSARIWLNFMDEMIVLARPQR
jgi:2-polyprenyl-3-methyl-5-hydroxy-6-metoxy-1,4-benzoquinol methylase